MALHKGGAVYDVSAIQADFATSATLHIHDVVRRLTAEHERLVASLWQENKDLHAQLGKEPFHSSFDHQPSCGSTRSARKPSFDRPKLPSGDSHHDRHAETHEELQICEEEALPRPPSMVVEKQITERTGSSEHREHRLKFKEQQVDTKARKPKDRSCLGRISHSIHSGQFDTVVGSIIVANTLVMSANLEYSGRVFQDQTIHKCAAAGDCSVQSQTIDDFFTASEHFFTAVFALELSLRLFLEGMAYLRSFSNGFDAIVVVVSMADSWILDPMGSDVMGSVAVIRLLRLMRLAKILRVVRVMKAFKSLRVLVSAVVNSVGALGWSMTLLFVLELVGAIFLAQVIQPFMEESDDPDLQKFMFKHFGTWTNSMLTVFEITMAPGGFIQYRRLYEDVHAFFGIFMAVYVCVVTFAVVRVITAMFLKATLSASDNDEKVTAMEKSKEWTSYVQSLEATAETETVGMLSFGELEDLLQMDHFSSWLEDVGLEPSEVIRIFMSLDQGSSQVLFTDLEAALRQMRGLPRSADIVINLYETRNIMFRVMKLESLLEERFPMPDAYEDVKERSPMHENSDDPALGLKRHSQKNVLAASCQ